MENKTVFCPDKISAYFRAEWLPLAFVTLSGLIYNIGLLAGPWFEGRLAQCLADILDGNETAAKMAVLVPAYILVRWPAQRCRVESSMQRVFVSRLRATTFARYRAVPVRALWPKASTACTSSASSQT